MKRANEIIVNEEGENLAIKKGRFSNGNDEYRGFLAINESEGQRACVENGGTNSGPVEKNGDPFEDLVSADLESPSRGELNKFNPWDFDLNIGLILGNLEEQNGGFLFDLSVPTPQNGGPVINEKKVDVIDIAADDSDDEVEVISYTHSYSNAKGKEIEIGAPGDGAKSLGLGLEMTGMNSAIGESSSLDRMRRFTREEKGEANEVNTWLSLEAINEKKLNVIDIASDDSDDEFDVIGYTYGHSNANGKEIERGVPSDGATSLSLGLEMIGTNNIVGESSSLDSLWRFTREEKGKANVVDTWLSLKAISLYLLSDSDESSGEEDTEIGTWRQAEFAVRSEMAERALRQADQALRMRENLVRETRQETARRLARVNFTGQNNVNEPYGKSQQLPTISPVKQLGNTAGPFSDALAMVRERIFKRPRKKLIEWKPLRENHGKSSTAPFVTALLDLSLKALAENAEGMISLEMVPDNLRERLTDRLCSMSKMDFHFLKLLVEGCPTEIRIKNSSWLTDKQFQQAFGNCQTKDLRVLQLDLCGQCMLDFAFEGIMSQSLNSFPSLAIVSLRGACRLSDNGLKALVTSAPLLRSINLGHCSLLTFQAINFIAESLGSNLRELYFDNCQKINPALTFPAFKKFKYLEVLSVAGSLTITDSFISQVITVCGRSIKELDLADCPKLSDCCLETIGSNCAGLCSLNISNLPKLTDLGIEYLANGCRSIQELKMCRNEFSDEAMAAYIESSGQSLKELILNHISKVGPNTALSIARRSRKLLSLDVSFCRGITDEALGLIVDSCLSLKLLKVFGCRQITNVFLNGHSNRDVKIVGLNLGPILDHVNWLEPEGVLLRYSSLPDAL